MTPRRAAAYLVLASLLLAWLASAAGLSRAPELPQQDTPRPVKTAGTETLAAEVQAQTLRLKERLASAPGPQDPARNPFAFAPREPLPVRRAPARLEPEPVAVVPPAPVEPPLALIGIAEDRSAQGPIRSAILTVDRGDLLTVKVGETLGGRYRVAAIGVDAVELADLATGGVRRLVLR